MKTIPRPILSLACKPVNRVADLLFAGNLLFTPADRHRFPAGIHWARGGRYKRENLARDKFPEINWIQPLPTVNGQYYARPDK